MNELDKLVYALEELDLNDQNYRVLMNHGNTRGPQGNFRNPKEEGSSFTEPVPRSDVNGVMELLEEDVDVNSIDLDGKTALQIAVYEVHGRTTLGDS
ncbi:hypothetical protein BC332_07972 [Capsicum chinense]|nr:hypothetical protein BC332_07971 [Capsicum chinense]PHU22865.1 hypothetical protein BC332_07972 [Capsicum chinense]